MNRDMRTLLLLRRVFSLSRSGKGLSASLVGTFSKEPGEGRVIAQRILLGYPPRVTLKRLEMSGGAELAMLASLLVSVPRSSSRMVGQKGEALSHLLERWLKAKDSRLMEDRVLRTRGYIMSAVLGGVLAMLGTLGPLVGSLSVLSGSPPPPAGSIVPAAAAMSALSSSMLGLFMSQRGFYVYPVVSLATFSLVAAAVGPLAQVPVVTLGGN